VALPREKQLALLKAAPAMCFSRAEPRHKQVGTVHMRMGCCILMKPVRGVQPCRMLCYSGSRQIEPG
jgi:hypothetical protein